MAQGTPRKLACDYAVLDSYSDFIIAIRRVKMGWLMITVKHTDDNSQEAADLGHEQILPPDFAKRVAGVDRSEARAPLGRE